MIRGLGTDMIEVDRLREKLSKDSGFREWVFSPAEIEYCEAKANKFEHYAARFAAKEAFLKAMGTGWTGATALNEIEVRHDGRGQPVVGLLGKTAEILSAEGIQRIWISISHLKAIACAVVLIET